MVSASDDTDRHRAPSWLERDGYRKAVLLSGHYPNRTEYLDAARGTLPQGHDGRAGPRRE